MDVYSKLEKAGERSEPNVRTIVIGDVHGSLGKLKALIDKVSPTDEDLVVFIGDIVDKGDDSRGCIELIAELTKTCEVIIVEGNHEEKLFKYRDRLNDDPETAAKMRKLDPEIERTRRQLEDKHYGILSGLLVKAWRFRVRQNGVVKDFCLVHGGVSPETPIVSASWEGMSNKERRNLATTLRMRYVRRTVKKGKERVIPVAYGQEQDGDIFWSEIYDGRFGTIIYGHEPRDEVRYDEHAIGIDTSAYKSGGKLTAVILQDDHEMEIVSV